MINVYTPKRPVTTHDWSLNVLKERKKVFKDQQTVDEYGNTVTKRLIVRPDDTKKWQYIGFAVYSILLFLLFYKII